MSRKNIIRLAAAVYIGVAILLYAIFGSSGQNNEFKPQDEFKLHAWIPIHLGSVDMSINRAVLYLFLACGLTAWAMIAIARRMQREPNAVQTAVEAIYDFANRDIVRGNMGEGLAVKWFAPIATLFMFIWVSNLIGYLPLPTSPEKFNVFGVHVPAFAIYAATANISIPLVLTLVVWFTYHVEGIRAKGFVPYLRSWIPAGVEGAAAGPIFAIEVISHFVRIISLSVRLFANMLAGHLLILFMAGGLGVLVGLAAIGWLTLPIAWFFFAFEITLIATLQAFIFATLTSIYIGGAVAEEH